MPTISQRLSAAYQGFMTGNVLTQKIGLGAGYSSHEDRLRRYAERFENYRGFVTRSNNLLLPRSQYKPLKYNFCKPICGFAAGFAVGPTIAWSVTGSSDNETQKLSKAAQDIWNRSEGDSEFLLAALTAAIYGDMVCSVRKRVGRILIEFPDPCICIPEFDPGDISRLLKMTVCYGEGDSEVEEVFTPGRSNIKGTKSYSTPEVPFVWIPNMAIKGQAFGDSELDVCMPLIEEYDHVAGKETRIIDRHASPAVKAKNLTKKDVDLEKGVDTVWYLSKPDADMEYLEWKGSRPDVGTHLDRIRNGLAEVSETPNIAFGQIDSGFSGASGVSLKVLYGPATQKGKRKQSLWGPRIERIMHMALELEGVRVEPEQVSMGFKDATPQNHNEFLEGLEIEKRIGASDEALLCKAGWAPEKAKQMVAEAEARAEKDAARQAKVFSRGSVVDE